RAPVVLPPPRGMGTRHGPGRAWLDIADRCALAGYTNVWTNGMANFTLASIGLSRADWDELAHATLMLGRITARAIAQLADPGLLELLDVPRPLAPLVAKAATDSPPNF